MELSDASKQDIAVSAFSTFDLFGTKEEMIDKHNTIKSNFEGSLSVEIHTCSLSCTPTRTSKNNLTFYGNY